MLFWRRSLFLLIFLSILGLFYSVPYLQSAPGVYVSGVSDATTTMANSSSTPILLVSAFPLSKSKHTYESTSGGYANFSGRLRPTFTSTRLWRWRRSYGSAAEVYQ
ncbi:hypothetical protein B0H14DRAFT_730323 [Mycena olivaceomarginata]|nr:hypothetical protein B0H14DRAFT_730323 [Mycena olivaceomarginata]